MNAVTILRQWTHVARDGASLAVRSWEPPEASPRATILLTHGMGEHTGRYNHVAEHLTAAGLRVLTWDLRGHGRSHGERGDIARYDLLVDDLQELWTLATAEGPQPVFLYGHSLGGQITLNFAVSHRPATAGLIITSPWFRLAFTPPSWKVSLAWAAAHLWPTFTQDTDVVPTRLSRDLDFLTAMPDMDLIHHRMSARMYHALIAGAVRAAREAVALPYPILLIHGECDPVTSVDATREFFQALRSLDKSLVIIPDALHETHNDLCRQQVLDRITAWLEERLPAS